MAKYLDLEVAILDIKPRIWRRFLLPENSTFLALHNAIQDAFGWEDCHLFEFQTSKGKQGIAASPDDEPFEGPAVPRANKVRVASYLAEAGATCLYVYDFGDNWDHSVKLKGIVEQPEIFKQRLLGGARACPPEDCGGVWGYEGYVEIVGLSDEELEKRAQKDEDVWERKEWIGDWNPEDFDLTAAQKNFNR